VLEEVFGTSLGVELDWRRREPSISSVLEKLNSYAEDRNTHFLIVIDEAQELRFLKGVQLSYRFMWFDVFHRIISFPLHRSLGLHPP
jgi:hypothetical protein